MFTRIIQSAFFSCAFLALSSAYALPLDAFEYTTSNLQGQTPEVSSAVNGQTASLVQSFGGAYGGTRSIQVTPINGTLACNARFMPSYPNSAAWLSFANAGGASGNLLLAYDGDTSPGLTNYKGLCNASGCLNLFQGSATAVVLGFYFDYLGGLPVDLAVTFYDAKDTSGQTYSRALLSVGSGHQGVPFKELSIPFAELKTVGPRGAADLANIGAFSVEIRGAKNLAADFGLSSIRTNGAAVTACNDGKDNDGDGAIDFPADFSCSAADDNDEANPLSQCQDKLDNDGDGLVDLNDPDCSSAQDNSESGTKPQCGDGIDNDKDGVIDALDPGCWRDPKDSKTYDPTLNNEAKATTACQDTIDNDFDGLIDMKDPGCSSPTDSSEDDEKSLLTLGVECIADNVDKTKTAYFSYNNTTDGDLTLTTSADSTTLNSLVVSKADEGKLTPPTLFKKGNSKGSIAVTFSGDFVTWIVRAPKSALSQATANSNTPKCAKVAITPECRQYKGGVMKVSMSYNNPNSFAQHIAVGPRNRFTPGADFRGQPSIFAPGFIKSAFEVVLDDTTPSLTWQLNGASATASLSLPTCDGGCSDTPTGSILGNLDKIANDLSDVMNRAAELLASSSDTATQSEKARDTRDAKRSKDKAARYKTLAGTLTIQFPAVVKTCPEAPAYCATVDRQSTIDGLRSLYANQRNSVMRTVARTYWRKTRTTNRNDTLVKRAKRLEQLGLSELAKLPRLATECK